MANTIEYIFSLQDKISAKIGNITITSDRMLNKFADLEKKNLSVTKTFNETGRTMGSLREKIAALQAEREWIPAENIEGIRAYNREMKKLNKEIVKLESLNGGKFKKWSKEAFSAIPDYITNPVTLGAAAIGFAGKNAMNFDEGMAKVNITAQLDESGLSDLNDKLKGIAKDNKTEITAIPIGFEQINSQVNDVDLSLSILDAALKGSKASTADLNTVSGALAQTLSIVGKENTNAKEVLDTFFAAKRVGAGEFADFARYIPNLIAGASNLGINFKEVAGTFAYMTGKGQSAERAAVLMENAFSVLGRADVRGKMEKAGVNVFDDTGKIRSVVDIFKDLQGVMGGLNDEQKSSLLEKLGLVDKEAKNAFAVMISDVTKLQESMNEVANSSGETDKALLFSQNTIQKAQEVWAQFGNIGTEIGVLILPAISAGLDIASLVLSGLCQIVETINNLFAWWFVQLQTGNPYIWGITAAITALSAALLISTIRTNSALLVTKAKIVWDGVLTVATWALTSAQLALNAAFIASPLGWVCAIIGVIVGVVTACWNNFEKFRQVVYGVWYVIKDFGKSLIDSVISPFKQVLSGIGSVCSALVDLVKGNFKEAAASAKSGFKDIGIGVLKSTPAAIVFEAAKKTDVKGAWKEGKQKGTESLQASQEKTKEADINSLLPQVPPVAKDAPKAVDYDALMKELAKTKKKTSDGNKRKNIFKLDDDSKVQNYSESSNYTAITKKLAPVKVDLRPNVQVTESVIHPAEKVVSARPLLARNTTKVDESKQEYLPEKTDYLKDIMTNVRKIAAVAAIPLAFNLSMPDKANATPVLQQVETQTNSVPKPDVVFAPSTAVNVPAVNVPKPDTPIVDVPNPTVAFAPSPAVNVPAVNVPRPDTPIVDVPNPAVAFVPSPAVNVPAVNVPKPDTPIVDVPNPAVAFAPSLAVNVPAVNVPKLNAPIVDVPNPAVAFAPSPAVNIPTQAVAFAEMPDIKTPESNAFTIERSEKVTESKETEHQIDTGRIIHVDRVCENIVINVANTDNRGKDEIRENIFEVLDELSMYEA